MADSVLLEVPGMKYACYFPSLESLLRYSLSRFLNTASNREADRPKFINVFASVLKAYQDPPLEASWFFFALKFRDLGHVPDDLLSILSIISAFAASSPAAAKPLALLAPVVSGLSHSDKPRREIEALVESVLRYIIRICRSHPAGGEVNADAGRLLPVFPGLVEAWIPRDSSGRCPFQVLFPLAGDEARRELMKEGCSVTFLAGVVVAEAFLLRLCLKVKVEGETGVPRSELQKQVLTWAISCIKGIKNQQFYGVLLNMLVNHPLPVHSSLSADDEILVRDVLYDALILSDYSVLSRAEVDRADGSLFPIFVSRLVITFDAITDARHKGDHEREALYINAFLTSNIPSYLTSWAILQAGTNQLGEPVAITPEAFLKWLVDLEDKGLKVFGENRSRIKERLMHDEGQNDNQSSTSQLDDDLFFIHKQSHQEGMDKKGGEDEEAVEMETADNALMAAAHSTMMMENDTRKRKDCRTEDPTVVKVVKYKAEDVSVKDYLQAKRGGESTV